MPVSPSSSSGAQAEDVDRLIVALNAATAASERSSTWIIRLTIVLVVLTVVLVVVGIVALV